MDFLDLNPGLTRKDLALKATANKFAREVMRPISKQLDLMSADRVIAPDSPLWVFLRKASGLGYHKLAFPRKLGGTGLNPLQVAIVMEELAWGSFGLTVSLNTSLCALLGLDETDGRLHEVTAAYCKCEDTNVGGGLAVTGSDYGADELMGNGSPGTAQGGQPWCVARLDADEYVISGRRSGWFSAGMTARYVLLNAQIDSSDGQVRGGIFLLPLDRPGVAQSEPQNKLGTRELSQGELYLDQVRLPREALVVGPELYLGALEAQLALLSPLVGIWATGLARAAFDEALAYTRNRQQDGRLDASHASLQQKLFDMFTKVEASRQLCRSALVHNWSCPPENRALEYGLAAKVFAAKTALSVTGDAIQLFGSDGISKEYIAEKLFRDAQTSLLCGGSNDTLAIAAAQKVLSSYPRSREPR